MRRRIAEARNNQEAQQIVLAHPTSVDDQNPTQLVKCIENAALDAKGIETVVLDVSKSFGLADYFMVISGRSDRHVQGLANKIIESLKKRGVEPYSIQGMEEGHWVVIDTVDVVVHIFYEPLRDRYDIESLWLNAGRVGNPELVSSKQEVKVA